MTLVLKVIIGCSLFFLFQNNSYAYTVQAQEYIRGEYQSGIFSPSTPRYVYEFDVDERSRKVVLNALTQLGQKRKETKIVYTISHIENKLIDGRRQKVMTLIREESDLGREVFILGESFFEYCKASSDRYIMASGKVSGSITLRRSFG